MKKIILLSTLVILSYAGGASTYYVDAANGNDNNDGTSPSKAWRSIAKVNQSDFLPGDSVLFKSGEAYAGQLELKLIGEPRKPVVVGSYGQGNKPEIRGNGEKRYALMLQDPSYCVVRDLEITNTGKEREARRLGVLISAENSGERYQVTLDNLTVKNVNGSLVKKEGGGGAISCVNRGDSIRTRFVGLKILNCRIVNCGRNGITVSGYWQRDNWYPNLEVSICGNILEGVPGDGIVPTGCDGAVIEHNIMRDSPDTMPFGDAAAGIWPWSCDNTLIQYNEVSGHDAKWDAQGFDSDDNSYNTVFQYNYSHDNAGGFMLVCSDGDSAGDGKNNGTGNTIVRYNVSINDGIRTFPTDRVGWFSPVIHISGPVTDTRFHNILIVVKKKTAPEIDRTMLKMEGWSGRWPEKTFFKNNIFYVEDDAESNFAHEGQTVFDGNTFIGDNFISKPDDKNSKTGDDVVIKLLKANDIEGIFKYLHAATQNDKNE